MITNTLSRRTLSGLKALAFVLAVSLTGCGDPPAPSGTVAGMVTLKGQPFGEAGLVFFDPATGNAATFSLDETGQFEGNEPVPVGSYKVTVGAKIPSEEEIAGGVVPEPVISKMIHPQFMDPASTPLTATIEQGQNHFEFEIFVETRKRQYFGYSNR